MPSPSNPSPRRRPPGTTAPASRPTQRAGATRTVDLGEAAPKTAPSAPRISDAGTKRRALKKKRSRQSNWLAWTVAGAITVAIAGTSAGIWTEFQTVKGRVSQKQATLTDLTAQFESGKRRLRALSSSSGKERVLVENGFIKPGERLLLFPQSKKK